MEEGDIISIGGVTKRLDPVRVHFGCAKDFCKYGPWIAFKRDMKDKIKRWLT